MNIDYIKISGFKSVADITLDQLTPYSVFAGPNGAGKSNLMDALAFVGAVIELGATKAIGQFHGFSHIYCHKLKKQKTKTFEFVMQARIEKEKEKFFYALTIHDMDKRPYLEEKLIVGSRVVFHRKVGERLTINAGVGYLDYADFPHDLSVLRLTKEELFKLPVYRYLTNIRVFRFDPYGAKEPDPAGTDASELDPRGHNLATILAAMEQDDDCHAQINEWMALLVPGMARVLTAQRRLDGRTMLKFKEIGSRTSFPANSVSDGAIHALCILTAVLSRGKGFGITLIEEPERGIHPKAITELVRLMRDNATPAHPVLVTTHSESLVRASTKEELWLLDKEDGKTVVKNAAKSSGDLGNLHLDTAWLMNMFGGGLPW